MALITMYPLIRLITELALVSRKPKIPLDGVHVSHHRCWPQDLDFFLEMNHGRILTIYDLGRIPGAQRTGILPVLRKNGWGFTMAGASVRYRKRITCFQKFTMHTQAIGRDDRFFYVAQSIWINGEAAGNILYRSAVTGNGKMVPPQTVLDAYGTPDWNPTLPAWVTNWIEAEATRPWPPEQ